MREQSWKLCNCRALLPSRSVPESTALLDPSASNSLPQRRMGEEIQLALHKALEVPSPCCALLLQGLQWVQWQQGTSQGSSAAVRVLGEFKALKNKM